MTSGLDPSIERLKDGGWRQIRAINAALASGAISEEAWHQAMIALIKPNYLAAESPYAQAGHSGNAETWEASRGFVADALHRDGTFLDAGCASGIMMESVRRWGAAKGLVIEPYGMDIVPEFVERAQRRLPQWADRFAVGNIRFWIPQHMRFDYVLIRLEYAPPPRRAAMARHILENVLQADGRLIVFVGAEEADLHGAEEAMIAEGLVTGGRVEVPHNKDARMVRRLFWIDGAG